MNNSLNLFTRVRRTLHMESTTDLPVVGHFIHKTIFHGIARLSIYTILPAGRKVLRFLYFFWPYSLCDTHHPEELVYIVTGVAEKTTENNKDVVNVVLAQNGVRFFFWTSHGATNSGNMSYKYMVLLFVPSD